MPQTVQPKDRFYIGTADAIEAEYGATAMFGGDFVVFQTYAGEPVSIEGFATLDAAKASLSDVEDRSTIEWVA